MICPFMSDSQNKQPCITSCALFHYGSQNNCRMIEMSSRTRELTMIFDKLVSMQGSIDDLKSAVDSVRSDAKAMP